MIILVLKYRLACTIDSFNKNTAIANVILLLENYNQKNNLVKSLFIPIYIDKKIQAHNKNYDTNFMVV